MNFIFDNDRPIYIQLVEQLKMNIVSGKLKIGSKLPSVRELALQTQVNPNTMQKALSELENEKLIYTERTNGKFITEDEARIKEIKNTLAEENAKKYLRDMKKLGVSGTEAIEYLQRLGGEE